MFFRKVLFFILFGLVGNLFANGFVGETVEMSLNEHEYYHDLTSDSTNVMSSSNGKYILVQYLTGNWSDGNLRYHLVKSNLDTGVKTELQAETNGRDFGLVGISDDGNKIIYKRNTGQGYGNFYRYIVDINHEENILIGPNGNTPDRQSYYGSTDKDCNHFLVYSYARNWVSSNFGHLFYRDLELNRTIIVDRGMNGEEANGDASINIGSYHIPKFIPGYIVYHSNATNIVEGVTNNRTNIYLLLP